MNHVLDRIWRVPAYLPYLQPPLSETMAASAETRIGHRLPLEFLDLLRRQNGGYIRHTLPDISHSMIYGIGPHFPSFLDQDWRNDRRDGLSYELDGLFPFDGDGHWYLCLDYREGGHTPCVTYINTECDDQHSVADSFAEYLSQLVADVDQDDYAVVNVSDTEEMKVQLGAALHVNFEPPQTGDHGYPASRARGGTQDNPQWLWLRPNLVPRGFVRPEDPRYESLRHLLPGEALQYPLLPGSACLLRITGQWKPQVLRECRRLQFDIRPLAEYAE